LPALNQGSKCSTSSPETDNKSDISWADASVGNSDFNHSMEIFMTQCEDKDLAFALLHHVSTRLLKANVKIKTATKHQQHQPTRAR
jgi:hypothetical protein